MLYDGKLAEGDEMSIFTKKYERILVVPDLHLPAQHKDAFSFLKAVKDKYDPDCVVFMGDIVDFHSMNYHEHNPELPSPQDEIDRVRDGVQKLAQLFPVAFCLYGNHDLLIHRKATTIGIPKIAIKELSDVIKSPPDWKWSKELKLMTEKGPVYFTHGRTSSIGKLAQMMGVSCVQAHYHSKYYINYIATPVNLYFDANFGCLIDKDHPAFLYGEQCVGKPVLGCGVIKNGRAIPVTMNLKPHGRWGGKL